MKSPQVGADEMTRNGHKADDGSDWPVGQRKRLHEWEVTGINGALFGLRAYIATAAAFSLAINLLYLAAPLYMMQISDRVLSSSSKATLVLLTLIVLVAFSTLAALDGLRARILARCATRLDRLLASRVFQIIMRPASANEHAGTQPIRDVETLRNFVAGHGMHALFDFPWTPIYVLIIYWLHPLLGGFAVACTVALIGMALINELWVRKTSLRASEASARAFALTDQSLRNFEVVHAMGMLSNLTTKWAGERVAVLSAQQTAGERAAIVSAIIRFLRLSMQSVILGLGAWLVIERAASAGSMFAASILLGRALQPVEQAAASWHALVAARHSFRRLSAILAAPIPVRWMEPLPRPAGQLTVSSISQVVPHADIPILRAVSLRVEPGEIIGIIGASGAGKSSLARLLVGAATPTAGRIDLDGHAIDDGLDDRVRRHIGYLPQDIELFAETIAANISRFAEPNAAQIVCAAKMAGVHEMILRLPQGYHTTIGAGGVRLSGGWQQRVALARAVYGHPSLVVLDEPNSNLDTEGEQSLAQCIERLRRQRTTVVVISHRPAMLRTVDKILVMSNGAVEWFGLRDELLRKIGQGRNLEKGTHAG